MARKSADDYAKNQRRIRSLQPKESSEKAHAQARRVLAKAAQQENLPFKPDKSSAGLGEKPA